MREPHDRIVICDNHPMFVCCSLVLSRLLDNPLQLGTVTWNGPKQNLTYHLQYNLDHGRLPSEHTICNGSSTVQSRCSQNIQNVMDHLQWHLDHGRLSSEHTERDGPSTVAFEPRETVLRTYRTKWTIHSGIRNTRDCPQNIQNVMDHLQWHLDHGRLSSEHTERDGPSTVASTLENFEARCTNKAN